MFTGLVSEVGKLLHHQWESGSIRISIHAPGICHHDLEIGDSVAVNGICLTVVKLGTDIFDVQAMVETVNKSTLPQWKTGMAVNLERALRLSDRLDGHLVAGHVDGLGDVVEIFWEGSAKRIIIKTDKSIMRYIASKGSIALDGISLTVASVDSETNFSVALIPHTLQHTTWRDIQAGRKINIEVDLIARYVERSMGNLHHSNGLTFEKLSEF